jgi:HlyD family secretion protein/adhesin transport system membrane fusion protein
MSDRRQIELMGEATRLEEQATPRLLRATVAALSLTVFAFVGWAAVADVKQVAHTVGEVMPEGRPQVIQHLEGGIVQDIMVEDGDLVSAGDVLVRLDEEEARADLAAARHRRLALALEAERLRAFIAGRTPDFSAFADAPPAMIGEHEAFFRDMVAARQREADVIGHEIAQSTRALDALRADLVAAEANLEVAREVERRRADLESRGLSSTMALLSDRQRVIELEGRVARLAADIRSAQDLIAQERSRLASLTARHRDAANEALADVSTSLAEVSERVDKLTSQIARKTLRAPVDGLVKGLSVNTIGSVLKAGEQVAEIVPVGRTLEVMVEIAPRDIGHLAVGQAVDVKLTSFDFTRYGTVKGTLVHISPTSFRTGEGRPYFRGRVRLDASEVSGQPILPGMTASAAIVTGEKTVLAYLLRPVQQSLTTAMTER